MGLGVVDRLRNTSQWAPKEQEGGGNPPPGPAPKMCCQKAGQETRPTLGQPADLPGRQQGVQPAVGNEHPVSQTCVGSISAFHLPCDLQ